MSKSYHTQCGGGPEYERFLIQGKIITNRSSAETTFGFLACNTYNTRTKFIQNKHRTNYFPCWIVHTPFFIWLLSRTRSTNDTWKIAIDGGFRNTIFTTSFYIIWMPCNKSVSSITMGIYMVAIYQTRSE